MKLEITCRNCECSEHLRSVTEKKLAKLDKYFNGDGADAKVCLKAEKDTLTTEVTLFYAGKFVKASATGETFYDNLDLVLPKLEGRIRKYRTIFDKNRKNSAFRSASEYDVTGKEENVKSKIVKKKQLSLTPMTVKEATEEMERLGHQFFVFKDVKTDTVQVIYKRNDGDLGIIKTIE